MASDKRYNVCTFPSMFGTPIKTNNKIFAYIIAWFRSFRNIEVRVIDNKTGKHILVL